MSARVTRLFEAHLVVEDLDRSIVFYRDQLGLEVAHRVPARQAAFLWIGSRGESMLGLWGVSGEAPKSNSHVAFATGLDAVLAAPQRLRSAGIAPLDFNGDPADEPVVLAWMPAAAVYFKDPDGHLLEYIAMLDEPARSDAGVVAWHEWSAVRPVLKPSSELPAGSLDSRHGIVLCRNEAECQELGTFLADRLFEFNAAATGYRDGLLLGGSVRDDAGHIVAGFQGHTWGGCCDLSVVWVDARYRGRGLGTSLLRSAEASAVARGCQVIVLTTHSFQAPGFYERLGYEQRYSIEDRPVGHADLIYVKLLGERRQNGV
jgi:lactoylglutathione lyase